ncbi:MAG: hypothetical protein JXR39_13310 [Marinilabiliaceae bacterium]|nr:hypothetical protein [Marinilabiliaceae bacterium]
MEVIGSLVACGAFGGGYVTGLSLLLGMAASLFELTYRKLGLAIVFVFTFSNLLFSFSHSQYADTLLSLFIVCSFVFYHHRNTGNAALLPLMAVFFAASAGWVKNEGLLFFGLFSCFYLVYNVKHFRRILLYGVGTLLPLVVIFIFKMGYAPANDIVASDADGYVAKLTDVSRYLVVGEYYYKNLLSGSQLLLLLVVGAVFAFLWYREMPLWVGGAMLAGYFGIYILSPYGLDWHLGTSFNRLMHHLTPFLIYSVFVCIGQRTNFETLCVRLDSKQ